MSEKLSKLLEQARAARLLQWKGFAIAFVGNEADADEVIQEACKRTLMADPPLETENEVHYYMLSAIRASAIDLLQSRKRLIPSGDIGDSHVDTRPDALDRLIGTEDAEEVKRLAARALELIEALPEPRRTIVKDLLLGDPKLTFRDLSEREDVPLTTLYRHVTGILNEIAEVILSEAPDPEAVLRLIREEPDV